MIRKIESRGYKVMYLSPYSPELNRLLTEESLSSRIGNACNDIPVEDLASFANHSSSGNNRLTNYQIRL